MSFCYFVDVGHAVSSVKQEAGIVQIVIGTTE